MKMSATSDIKRPDVEHYPVPKFEGPIQPSPLGAMRYILGTEQVVVSPDEDRELYHIHLRTFRDNYQPQGATEEHLVQSLADVSWRLNRIVALETNLLSIGYSPRDFVPGLLDQAKALANLSLHSQRLSRQFERTVAQLRDLQQTRHSQEQQDLDNLLDIMELHEEKGQTYSPSEDGFVFSPSQITRAIQARRRDRLLDETHRAAA
jgi:hypothetical protein